MSGYLIEMFIFSVVYLMCVYLIVRLVRKLNIKGRKKNDDDDGGIELYEEPTLDLPPGVTRPDGGPAIKLEEREEVFL